MKTNIVLSFILGFLAYLTMDIVLEATVFKEEAVEITRDIEFPSHEWGVSPNYSGPDPIMGTLKKGSICYNDGEKGTMRYVNCRLMLPQSFTKIVKLKWNLQQL